jgi:hypothetical protein
MNLMNIIRFIFFTIIIGTLVAVNAQVPPPTAPIKKTLENEFPLFFPVDRNNIKILPQRFEYNLIAEDQIKIGDILIDYTSFGFQISPSVNFSGKYRARFVWPSGLLQDGSLLLKDNTGKAIWTTNFNQNNIHLTKPKLNEQDIAQNKDLRNQLAEIIVDQLSPDLIEDMKYFPFMKFCISSASQDTHIYVCSKEVYLTSKDNRLTIKARSQDKRTPFFEINGKSVGSQGIILLNSENENIGFRAMTQSGALLEVETRMKSVDFKDAVLSDDKKELVLTASGAEPVNADQIKRISDTEWQMNLDASRPVFYLKGEGNIPMRQEFYIQGEIPLETARPTLEKDTFNHIYKSEISLRGHFAPGTSVSSNTPDEKVEKTGSNGYIWHLTGIPAGETSRHYLRVSQNQNSFLAAYDIHRDFPFEARLLGSYCTPAGQLSADIYADWWLENFMGSAAPWARQHWGVNFKDSVILTKKDGEANINIAHLELLWRANPGFHFQNKTWGLSLPYEMIQTTGANVSSFGIGIFYRDQVQKSPQKPYQRYLHRYDLKFNYFIGGSSGDTKLKNAMQLNALGHYDVNKHLSWNYGLGISQYSFDSGIADPSSKMQIKIIGGASYRF